MSNQKNKKISDYEERKRGSIDIEVEKDVPNKIILYISWPTPSKKNQKQAFRWIVLPSKNYLRRHKILIDKIWDTKRNYNTFPCKICVTTIAGTKAKWDVDNILTSYLDLLCDMGLLPDDNKFIIPEIYVKNLGYVKNCWLTRIEITPYEWECCDIIDDHKWNRLLDFKRYLDDYSI